MRELPSNPAQSKTAPETAPASPPASHPADPLPVSPPEREVVLRVIAGLRNA